MYKIEYEIKLNATGRPCIDLPEEHEDKPEDKFFALELTRYVLQDVFSRRSKDFNPETTENLELAINLLGQIGDEVAALIWDGMKTSGDVAMILDSAYHFQVNSIEERDNLPFDYFAHSDKIFKRQEGLKVYVQYPIENYDAEKSGLYILKGGIENENWVKISKRPSIKLTDES